MKNKRKNHSGITLLALVITIIIMLILAIVSIRAFLSNGGVIQRATESKVEAEMMHSQEQVEAVMMLYEVSDYYGLDSGLERYLNEEKAAKRIDNYISSTDGRTLLIEKDGYYFEWEKDQAEDDSYRAESIGEEASRFIREEVKKYFGVGDDYPLTIITQTTIDEETQYEFYDGQIYIVLDENLIGSNFDFRIPTGSGVSIAVLHDMYIDNSSAPDRAAMTIEPGATLNLYISGTVTVKSSLGATAPVNEGDGARGGHGGYAGINVPEGATLNLYGNGILYAIGGDASDGGRSVSKNAGGGGGGGAGAGIGGNGGNGGDSNCLNFRDYYDPLYRSGMNGKDGQNCGNVTINDGLTVYAVGGGGGSGGEVTTVKMGSGSGGGGYPAAGIGGGGAGGGGGDHANGAGGFSAGVGEDGSYNWRVSNGYFWNEPVQHCRWISGSSYYGNRKFDQRVMSGSSYNVYTDGLVTGGQGGFTKSYYKGYNYDAYKFHPSDTFTCAGDGGVAGKGGTIKAVSTAKVYAYNGNMVTEDDWDYANDKIYKSDLEGYEEGEQIEPVEIYGKTIVPSIIYVQDGVLREVRKCVYYWNKKDDLTYDYFANLFGDTLNGGLGGVLAKDPTIGTDDNPAAINIDNIKTYYPNTTTDYNFVELPVLGADGTDSNGILKCGEYTNSHGNKVQVRCNADYRNWTIRKQIAESNDEFNIKTRYQNSKNKNTCQGIGSGAGYIELSNGTFTLIDVNH